MDGAIAENDYVAVLLDCLDADGMSLIDFDELRDWIEQQLGRNEASETVEAELNCLRDDYQKRIAGMIKAIAVADRKGDRYESALQLIEDLPSMTSAELTDCYRRTSARFRDMFPTSLGQYLTRSNKHNPRDLSVYK